MKLIIQDDKGNKIAEVPNIQSYQLWKTTQRKRKLGNDVLGRVISFLLQNPKHPEYVEWLNGTGSAEFMDNFGVMTDRTTKG